MLVCDGSATLTRAIITSKILLTYVAHILLMIGSSSSEVHVICYLTLGKQSLENILFCYVIIVSREKTRPLRFI